MIWDRMLNAELAEPAIREVHLNFATDQPLRADREDISHDQHPDHQFRINRRPTHGRIMRCKLPDDLQGLRHRAEIGRKAALVRSSGVPSWLAPTKIRVSKMESRFAASLNGLLQHGVIPGSSQTKTRESALQERMGPA